MDDEQHRLEVEEDKIKALDPKVSAIDKDLTKYRGMVGGILLVITAVVTFVKLSWGFITDHVTLK